MTDGEQVAFIDPMTLAEWIARGEATVYDVREDHEWREARIPGAILLPLSRFDPAAVTATDDSRLVLHCRSGVRCGVAAERLIEAGVTRPIWRLDGGIIQWARAGQPVERD